MLLFFIVTILSSRVHKQYSHHCCCFFRRLLCVSAKISKPSHLNYTSQNTPNYTHWLV